MLREIREFRMERGRKSGEQRRRPWYLAPVGRRRGDIILRVSPKRLRIIVPTAAAVIIFVFVVGFLAGRLSAPEPVIIADLPVTHRSDSAAFSPVGETLLVETGTRAEKGGERSRGKKSPSHHNSRAMEKRISKISPSGEGRRRSSAEGTAALKKDRALKNAGSNTRERVVSRKGDEKRAAKPMVKESALAAEKMVGKGTLFAIVVRSMELTQDTEAVWRRARALRDDLRSSGFPNAYLREARVRGKGAYLRVIAEERRFPSALAARREIERMKKAGRIPSGWPLMLGGK